MHVVINNSSLVVNGTPFSEAPPLPAILTALGSTVTREKLVSNQETPWRKFVILDDLGVYLLFDFEINRVLDAHFVFKPGNGTADPNSPFSGMFFLNKTRFVAGMKESNFPLQGEFTFFQAGGWIAQSESLFLSLRTERKQKRLEAVGITFLKRPKFSVE